jgi:hypothetical protein
MVGGLGVGSSAGLVAFALLIGMIWAAVWICIPERPRANKDAAETQDAERQRRASQAAAPDSWWQVLGVPPQASLEEITQRYRHALRMYHPDRLTGLAPELVALAERRTKELNAAFSQAKRLRSRMAQ